MNIINTGILLLCAALITSVLFSGSPDMLLSPALLLSMGGLFAVGLHFTINAEKYAKGQRFLIILYRTSAVTLPAACLIIRFLFK